MKNDNPNTIGGGGMRVEAVDPPLTPEQIVGEFHVDNRLSSHMGGTRILIFETVTGEHKNVPETNFPEEWWGANEKRYF